MASLGHNVLTTVYFHQSDYFHQHIEAWTKWPIFLQTIFSSVFPWMKNFVFQIKFDCLFIRLLKLIAKKPPKLCITGHLRGEPLRWIPLTKASNTASVSMTSSRLYEICFVFSVRPKTKTTPGEESSGDPEKKAKTPRANPDDDTI